MHVLVTSPVPSHPQNHGNRARVYTVCKLLQARGYVVHFVYGGLEGLSPAQETAMRRTWDHVHIIPQSEISKKQSGRDHHLIDDWHPDALTQLTTRIIDTWNIEICVANYVWFSKWLESVPPSITKIIDTHDVFANRHARLNDAGLSASWFSTTEAEEAKALQRADTVLAIQSEEAAQFSALGAADVRVFGHLVDANFAQGTQKSGKKLKVGYLSSDNPINQHSLRLLAEELTNSSALQDACSFHLAGSICNSEAAQSELFELRGFVEDAAAFHHAMDVIINPNIGGTGLKIKSVEALSYGRPFVATEDAMIGIPSKSPFHQCGDVPNLCAKLLELAANPNTRKALAQTGNAVFEAYQSTRQETLQALFPDISVERAL